MTTTIEFLGHTVKIGLYTDDRRNFGVSLKAFEKDADGPNDVKDETIVTFRRITSFRPSK